MQQVTEELVLSHGLTIDEYLKIKKLLNRDINILELGMFSVMWSEHCSYKSSKQMLKTLPTKSDLVIQGPGENAGVVDVGDGMAVVMKIESHNHPSALEPYQGAATGVGGIIRDILAMGAEPIAILNSLRFGPFNLDSSKYLFDEVVRGISFYGNCVGVPTVGGEVYFQDTYQGNPLVNVMCVGLVDKNRIMKATAEGEGNLLIYVGALTGRDGLAGAAFASKNLDDDDDDRDSIQVADPFLGKLLIDAILAICDKDYVVGIQDMGAAGLTSSSSEMAFRGKSGLSIDLSAVPLRDSNMTPYEIMLSESQERMLVVVKKGFENQIIGILESFNVNCSVIGEVTSSSNLELYFGDVKCADLPVKALVDNDFDEFLFLNKKNNNKNSLQKRKIKRIESQSGFNDFISFYDKDINCSNFDVEYNAIFLDLLRSPNIVSKKFIYQQFDYSVKTNTLIAPGHSDAAIIRLKGSRKAIALTVDCNSYFCSIDPYIGSQIAVSEAARNLSVVGAEPIALTDGLNFGNPKNDDVYIQFEQSIAGIKNACEILSVPVVSGNVSLYNENSMGAINPTPIIGMMGIIEDVNNIVSMSFKNIGDIVILLGDLIEYNKLRGKSDKFIDDYAFYQNSYIDVFFEKKLQKLCRDLIKKNLLASAHDVSDGGIAINLAESCIFGNLGVSVYFNGFFSSFVQLMEVINSCVIISVSPSNLDTVLQEIQKNLIPYIKIGSVNDKCNLFVDGFFNVSLQEIKKHFFSFGV